MLDLEAIKARWLSPNYDSDDRSIMAITDIPLLIAEVERIAVVLGRIADWEDAGESILPDDLYQAVMDALGRPAV